MSTITVADLTPARLNGKRGDYVAIFDAGERYPNGKKKVRQFYGHDAEEAEGKRWQWLATQGQDNDLLPPPEPREDDLVPVPVPDTPMGTGTGTPDESPFPDVPGTFREQQEQAGPSLWFDVAGMLDHGIPEPPRPTICRRTDGVGLFYAGQSCTVFGDPESGKTWLVLSAAVEVLDGGGSVAVLDLDHNGPEQTVSRLVQLGADQDALRDPQRFRYIEPEDKPHLLAIVRSYCGWRPDFVVVDSVGELLPTLGLNSANPDDYTQANTAVMKPLAASGACVVTIDHMAKNSDSRAMGATGTYAKKRAVGGTSLRVVVDDQFTPGSGGSAYLYVNKDRPGGLRRYCPQGKKEPLAGLFRMTEEDDGLHWRVLIPDDAPAPPSTEGPGSKGGMTVEAAVDKLVEMFPDGPPRTHRDIRVALGCSNDLAADVRHALADVPVPQPPVSRGTGTRNKRICTVCGEPLIGSDPAVTTHPNCESEEVFA